MVSNSTGIILNDHLKLFSKSKHSHNYLIDSKQRPLNWYTPLLITDQETGYPVCMLSAAGGGLNNFQVAVQMVNTIFIDIKLENAPTVYHIVNEFRYVFAYPYRYKRSSNRSVIEILLRSPTILTESVYLEKQIMDAFDDNDLLFSKSFRFALGNSSNFAFVSLMFLTDIPHPTPYFDARTKGDFKWISKFPLLNLLFV